MPLLGRAGSVTDPACLWTMSVPVVPGAGNGPGSRRVWSVYPLGKKDPDEAAYLFRSFLTVLILQERNTLSAQWPRC